MMRVRAAASDDRRCMQQDLLADLPLDGVQRVERCHRLLENDGNVVAADFPDFEFSGGPSSSCAFEK